MKSQKLAFAAILALSAVAASAQSLASSFSGEVGYAALEVDGGFSTSPSMLRATLAYPINQNLAVEGMIGVSAASSDTTVNAVTINTKVDNAYGLYLKPKYQVTPDLEVFGRLGYTTATLIASAQGVSASDTQSDISYGIGVSYRLAPTTYLALDYMSYYDKNGGTITGTTLGLGYKF